VQRRVSAQSAEDVAAEVFVVVWCRHEDARARILGIARKLLLNADRNERRRHALGVRRAEGTGASFPPDGTEAVLNRVDPGRTWRRLSAPRQEAIVLAAFEELTAPQAATVLGICRVAFRLRLSRPAPVGAGPHRRKDDHARNRIDLDQAL